MKPHPQLKKFLSLYSQEIIELTMQLRDYITNLVPDANELIWDNYNAVALAYAKSEELKDAFVHIAVYSKHVNFGFNRGAELTNQQNIALNGNGKLIRHIKVKNIDTFLKMELDALIWEALGRSEQLNPVLLEKVSMGRSIVKSISKKKVRPS